MNNIQANAHRAADFLKGFTSPARLVLLCHLVEGEKNVSTLTALTGLPQSVVSQHLKKLKDLGILSDRRDHRMIFYRISHPTALEILKTLHQSFCT